MTKSDYWKQMSSKYYEINKEKMTVNDVKCHQIDDLRITWYRWS